MTAILIRLPDHLLAEIDQLAEETYTNRSVFIRQACGRHIHIIRNVELPAIRSHYKQQNPKTYLTPLKGTTNHAVLKRYLKTRNLPCALKNPKRL
jgi:1,2-phenylacetyl-CoA epoxidase PaaB subunit